MKRAPAGRFRLVDAVRLSTSGASVGVTVRASGCPRFSATKGLALGVRLHLAPLPFFMGRRDHCQVFSARRVDVTAVGERLNRRVLAEPVSADAGKVRAAHGPKRLLI